MLIIFSRCLTKKNPVNIQTYDDDDNEDNYCDGDSNDDHGDGDGNDADSVILT